MIPRHFCRSFTPAFSRRDLLRASANGFGLLALGGLFAQQAQADVRKPHFAPKAKRIIFLFMHGGPSQVDTFDHKPLLTKHDGKEFPGTKPRVQFAATGNLMKSPWAFKPGGKSGILVSDLFPKVRELADELCVIRSVHADNSAHGGALLQLHTGSDTFIRPSMGSWVNYGLGSENANLPGFVTICPSYGHGGVQNWSSAYLPAEFQGTPIGNSGSKAKDLKFADTGTDKAAALQRMQLDLLQLNERDAPQARRHRRRARRTDPVVRAGLPHADRSAEGDGRWTCPARRRKPKTCTASTRNRPTTSAGSACWRGGSPRPGCDSCRCRTATSGTSTGR